MRLKQTRKKNISLHKNFNIIQFLAEADKGKQPNWIGFVFLICVLQGIINKSLMHEI